MKWHKDDVKTYVSAKEYIDTLLIPLLHFQLQHDQDLEKDAFQTEVMTIYMNEIEKELSGRIFVTPPYSYIKQAEPFSYEVERLNSWIEHAKEQPFEHIFLLTFDNMWKKVEKDVVGQVLWLPSVKPMDLNTKEAVAVLRSQVEDISELIRSFW